MKEDRELAHHGQRMRRSDPMGQHRAWFPLPRPHRQHPPGPLFFVLRGQFELCFLHAKPSPSLPGSKALPSVCAGALFLPWAPLTPLACLPPLPLVTPGLFSGSTRLGFSYFVVVVKLAHIHTEALLSLEQFTCSMFQKTFYQKERGYSCCQTPPPLALFLLTLPLTGQAPQPLLRRRGVPSGYSAIAAPE